MLVSLVSGVLEILRKSRGSAAHQPSMSLPTCLNAIVCLIQHSQLGFVCAEQ